jgi:signal transduction histidine kinase
MAALAAVASVVTVVNLLVLSHLMLLDRASLAELALITLYSVTAGLIAALIVARSTSAAIERLAAMAGSLNHERLDARVGDLHAGRELQLLGETLDQAARRLQLAIATERRMEAERRDLITSLSHDLRTPLASLRSMIEAIDDGIVSDRATLDRYASEMRSAVGSLVQMVDDIFELTSIDALEPAAVADASLEDLVRQAVSSCALTASAKSVTIEVDLGDAAGCPCSPRLARVAHSLVDNAVRHTPEGGAIAIVARHVADGLEIAVEDSGVGIPADQLAHVFEPFWRADPARTERGSGLGLTLAQRIVEALGGHIEASSVPNHGARFAIRLPFG